MGGIVGVGMMDGWKKGVNWKLFSKQVSAALHTELLARLVHAALNNLQADTGPLRISSF